MKTFDVPTLTLADLEGTCALDSIVKAARLRGVTPDEILAEVSAEPLSIDELSVGLQLRADDIIDDHFAEEAAALRDREARQ